MIFDEAPGLALEKCPRRNPEETWEIIGPFRPNLQQRGRRQVLPRRERNTFQVRRFYEICRPSKNSRSDPPVIV